MPQCPVCQNRYIGGSELCPLCGWNLQPYSLMVGILPEVSEKEKQRLDWAKSIWREIQPQRTQIIQLKQQIETLAQTAADLQSQLDRAHQEQHDLHHLLQGRETIEFQLQDQLLQAKAELHELQARLSQSAVRSQFPSPIAAASVSPATLPAYLTTIQSLQLNPEGELVQSVAQTLPCYRETGAGTEFELVPIASGNFWMGSPDSELGRDTHESPRRLVAIAPFLMGRFLVTQAQWRAVAHLESVDRPLDPDPSHFKGDSLPIERVSWWDAVEFCARLSRVTGRSYRLPSEAEWEYACRAGTQTPFHLGETLNPDWVNYDGNDSYGAGPVGLYRQSTTPVGTLAFNGFGLADMHGNVWEWCADPWHNDYQDAPANGSVWQIGGIEKHRVLRGGAWYCLPELCRSAQRHWDEVNHSGSGIGFRIVCSML